MSPISLNNFSDNCIFYNQVTIIIIIIITMVSFRGWNALSHPSPSPCSQLWIPDHSSLLFLSFFFFFFFFSCFQYAERKTHVFFFFFVRGIRSVPQSIKRAPAAKRRYTKKSRSIMKNRYSTRLSLPLHLDELWIFQWNYKREKRRSFKLQHRPGFSRLIKPCGKTRVCNARSTSLTLNKQERGEIKIFSLSCVSSVMLSYRGIKRSVK